MIECRVCGNRFRFLPPHLIRTHGVTANEYRATYGIPAGTPLCSDDYSEAHRSKIRRMQASGSLTYENLQAATDAARTVGRGVRTAEDLARQAERARGLPRQQLPPGAKRTNGRDADRAREAQRRRRKGK